MILKLDSRGFITLEGKEAVLSGLNAVQAQSVLLKLGFEPDCLFETLWAFEEHGWNETLLGLTGSFIYGEYKGAVS
jgi:hypothetical protein